MTSRHDRKLELRWGLKLPQRYLSTAWEMQDSLLSRLMRTTSPNLKRARYAAMYGASWQLISTRRISR